MSQFNDRIIYFFQFARKSPIYCCFDHKLQTKHEKGNERAINIRTHAHPGSNSATEFIFRSSGIADPHRCLRAFRRCRARRPWPQARGRIVARSAMLRASRSIRGEAARQLPAQLGLRDFGVLEGLPGPFGEPRHQPTNRRHRLGARQSRKRGAAISTVLQRANGQAQGC